MAQNGNDENPDTSLNGRDNGQYLLILTLITINLLLGWTFIFMGAKLGLVDVPNSRKLHAGEIPLTGGITIFLSILIGTIYLGTTLYTANLLVIAMIVFVVGVYDDRTHISARVRLLIQYGSGLALATYGEISIRNLGNLLSFGDISLLILSVPLTALSVAGLCNAYNMIDGIDGLAAATILLPLLLLYGLANVRDHVMADALLLMIVPICVFLMFNLGPNTRIFPKVFLGDGGSTTLGFLVTASLVYFSQGENALIRPVTALWLVAVPLVDMVVTLIRRRRRGHNLMVADRSHLHHSLLSLGLSTRQALAVIVSYSGLCLALGLLLENWTESLSLLCFFLLFIAHCGFAMSSETASETKQECA